MVQSSARRRLPLRPGPAARDVAEPVPAPIILPSGEQLRGAQSAAEINFADYEPLERHFARRYERTLGDDAFGIAMMALFSASLRWDPARGPFPVVAKLHLRSSLNCEVDRRLRQDGFRLGDRPKSKYLAKQWGGTKQLQSYAVVSQNAVSPGGTDVDLLEQIASADLDPEQRMIAAERSRRVVTKVRTATRRSTNPRARQILMKNGSVAAMLAELSRLPKGELDALRRELLNLKDAA